MGVLGACAIFLLGGCGGSLIESESAISPTIVDFEPDDDAVLLGEITDFEWDRVYMFESGVRKDSIDERIGAELFGDDEEILIGQGQLLVFVLGDEVAHAGWHSSSPGLEQLDRDEEGHRAETAAVSWLSDSPPALLLWDVADIDEPSAPTTPEQPQDDAGDDSAAALDLPATTSDEPPLEQIAELVEIAEPRLTNVVVTETEPAGGSWIAARGTAELRDDMVEVLTDDAIDASCGLTGDQAGGRFDRRVYRPGPTAGAMGTFEFELAPEPAAEKAARDDEIDLDLVSSGGWYNGAWGDGTVDGIEGFVVDGIGEDDIEPATSVTADWVLEGSPDFDAFCADAAASS